MGPTNKSSVQKMVRVSTWIELELEYLMACSLSLADDAVNFVNDDNDNMGKGLKQRLYESTVIL